MRSSADWVVWTLVTAWYLTLGQRALTVATAAVLAGLVALAHPLGTAPLNAWLGWSLGCFVVGWVFQFVGHYWEGRKPAFVDDLRGLLIGPMFVVAEAWFALGGGQALVDLIVEHTHTCYLGDRTHRHAWGWGCGSCPACELRARGWDNYAAPVV